MRDLVFGRDSEIARWVEAGLELPSLYLGPDATAFGIARDGELIGGAVYNNWQPPNIALTFYSTTPLWASKTTIPCIFRYPFVQLGCLRLTAYTKAKNERARTGLLKLGFEQEGYHPHGFPDDDAVSYGMLREKCRWVKSEIGPEASNAN